MIAGIACLALFGGIRHGVIAGQGAIGSDPAGAAIIADDPSFRPQRLLLMDMPKPSGPVGTLFNGKNLTGWDVWLGGPSGTPIGFNHDTAGTFTVMMQDGEPVIRVSLIKTQSLFI